MREKYKNMSEGNLKDLKIDERFMTAFCYPAQSNPSFKGSKAISMSSNNLNPFFQRSRICDVIQRILKIIFLANFYEILKI